MLSPSDHAAGFLPADRIGTLTGTLSAAGYRCFGPAVEEGAIVFAPLASGAAPARGLQADQAPGRYRIGQDPQNRYFAWATGPQAIKPRAFAAQETLWQARRNASGTLRFEVVEPPRDPVALIGVRACDLAALALQDAHFIQPGRRDAHYARRRDDLFLVAVQCAVPASTCFCASTGDGPTPTSGYDLSLVELADGFVVTAGSVPGAAILKTLALAPATAAQLDSAREQGEAAAAAQVRRLPDRDLRAPLMNALEHASWDEVAARCLACGNCTAVCPTCFCHAEHDTPALDGESSTHARFWDSCFGESHGHLHGFNVRPDTRSRYRQWLTHKLATWHDQYGRSGCVGCGRCIAWCPVGIDITEEAAALVAGMTIPQSSPESGSGSGGAR